MKATNLSELKSHFLTNGNEFDVRYLSASSQSAASSSQERLVDEFFSEQFRKPCTFSTKELADELLKTKQDSYSENFEQFSDAWAQSVCSARKNSQQSKQNIESAVAPMQKNTADDHWAQFLKSNNGPLLSRAARPSFGFRRDFDSRMSNIPEHWSNYLREEEECKEWFDAIDQHETVTPIEKQPMNQPRQESSSIVYTNEENVLPEYDQLETNSVIYMEDDTQQQIDEYIFSEQNPYVNISNALEEGISRFNQGDYPGAVLCLESACRSDTENATAWLYLGKAHAYNEQDDWAIKALQKCLKLESANLDALTTLSCSYANECEYNLAFESLKRWLCSNDKYKHLTGSLDVDWTQLGHRFMEKYDLLKEVFLRAIQFELNKGVWDADLQNGLGILMNVSAEYEKAADCFRTALRVKPNDAILWNRLGATLANGHMYGEAIEAYRKALSLLPGFVRARYNVGVACISLKAYDAAIQHFLTTLSQQVKASGYQNENVEFNQTSDSIWQAVRTTLILSGKIENLGLVYDRNLIELNKIFNVADN